MLPVTPGLVSLTRPPPSAATRAWDARALSQLNGMSASRIKINPNFRDPTSLGADVFGVS